MRNNLKRNRSWIIITTLVILIPMFVGLIMWRKLPERLPIHFNFSGEVDGTAGKVFGVFFAPIYCLFVQAIVVLACSSDPKNADGKAIGDKVYRLVLSIIPASSVYCGILIYGSALGWSMNVLRISQLFLAGVFLCLGNYMPKVRQNYIVGARLPWTLEDTEIWAKTNRLSGWLFMLGGVLFLLNVFLEIGGAWGMCVILIAQTMVLGIVPVLYSYILYQKNGGAGKGKE